MDDSERDRAFALRSLDKLWGNRLTAPHTYLRLLRLAGVSTAEIVSAVASQIDVDLGPFEAHLSAGQDHAAEDHVVRALTDRRLCVGWAAQGELQRVMNEGRFDLYAAITDRFTKERVRKGLGRSE